MDGGRVLRVAARDADALPAKATQYAARVGQAFAIVLGIAGFYWSPILLFIALFVWLGAAAEGAEAQIRNGLEGIPVRAAMVTDFRSLAPEDPLSRATELILAGAQEDFPVLAEGRLVGILTRNNLLRALSEAGSAQPVSGAMDRSFETADPSEMLSDVLPRMRGGETHTVPVVRDDQLLGLLTPENVSDFLSIQAATQATSRVRPRPGHAAV
jgi:CBS domain-containing protein